MTTLTLHLPYAPSVNRIWRRGQSATYKDSKAVDYCRAVNDVRMFHDKREGPIFPAGVGVFVELTMHPKLSKVLEKNGLAGYDPLQVMRQDVDAPIKIVLDAMQHARIFENDKQVLALSSAIGGPVKGGGITVRVWQHERGDA